MKLIPNYQLSILPEESFAPEMDAIAEELKKYRVEGMFTGFDGQSLYYEYFQAQDSKGAVVVVHGLSEFSFKYHEFAWYLLHQGYDVFLYDQRCHGRSCRLTPRQDLIHVGKFSHYRKDLQCFLDQVVNKVTAGPLYLYGHSMGGAVAIDYLAHAPAVFQKAVLSAPMVEPLVGNVPILVARWGLAACLLFQDGKKKFWLSKEFDPDYPPSRSQDKSPARFLRNMQARLDNPCYRTTPQTLRWVHQSLLLRAKFTRKYFVNKIRTPILMLCAQNERIVSAKAQEAFVKKCPLCRQVVLADTFHGMLWGKTETVAEHVNLVINHFC